jgi:Ni/Co efflux regulator RcnB
MNKKIIVPALVIAALGGGTAAAWAQDRGYHDERSWQQREPDNRWQEQRARDDRWQDRRDIRRDARDYRDRDMRGGWGRTADFNAGYDGGGPYHDMYRGDRLPSRYRNHQYVVDNWRAHRLHAPPRGYHWVQTGADYMLVAIATGVIADMIINH